MLSSSSMLQLNKGAEPAAVHDTVLRAVLRHATAVNRGLQKHWTMTMTIQWSLMTTTTTRCRGRMTQSHKTAPQTAVHAALLAASHRRTWPDTWLPHAHHSMAGQSTWHCEHVEKWIQQRCSQ